MSDPALQVERSENGATAELRLGGTLDKHSGQASWLELKKHLAGAGAFKVDLSGLERMDGIGAAFLIAMRRDVETEGGTVDFVGATEDADVLLRLYGTTTEDCPDCPERATGFLTQVGQATLEVLGRTKEVLAFIGDLLIAVGAAIRAPRTVQWRGLGGLMEKAGVDGAPIVLLINFLIGAIMGLQSALQLEQFGVGIYVADLVGKSLTRELGPLMTAIIVAGRSGAAYAAEIGTMKVSEEVDALRTLNLDPLRYLVLPRVIALAAMVPLLTLFADAVGCFGGLLVGVTMLDLTPVAYITQLTGSLTLWDVFGGLIKAAVFAVAITLIACQRGLATRAGAAGVGAATTSAVVTILFTIIALDAAFTWLFAILDI